MKTINKDKATLMICFVLLTTPALAQGTFPPTLLTEMIPEACKRIESQESGMYILSNQEVYKAVFVCGTSKTITGTVIANICGFCYATDIGKPGYEDYVNIYSGGAVCKDGRLVTEIAGNPFGPTYWFPWPKDQTMAKLQTMANEAKKTYQTRVSDMKK